MILTRGEVIGSLNELIVVPATQTVRGLATEVILTLDDGMPITYALNFDHISLAPTAPSWSSPLQSAGSALARSAKRTTSCLRLRSHGRELIESRLIDAREDYEKWIKENDEEGMTVRSLSAARATSLPTSTIRILKRHWRNPD